MFPLLVTSRSVELQGGRLGGNDGLQVQVITAAERNNCHLLQAHRRVLPAKTFKVILLKRFVVPVVLFSEADSRKSVTREGHFDLVHRVVCRHLGREADS